MINRTLIKKFENRKFSLKVTIFIFLSYLVIWFIERSIILNYFPFDFANDISSHMAKLFFLAKYGYFHIVPNWYVNLGYVLFRSYPPGWYLMTLPLYYLTKNVQVATYVSLVLIYLLSLLIIIFMHKRLNFSKLEAITYFALLFANPISIGYLFRLGKMPELTGWMFSLIIFSMLVYYKDHKIDKRFMFISLIIGLWLLSNLTSFIAMSPLLLGFYLVKSRDRFYVAVSYIFGVILASFWLIPFLQHSFVSNGFASVHYTRWLLSLNNFIDQITTWFTSLFLITIFFYSYRIDKSKRNLIFYLPIIIIAFLVTTRLIFFIPIFNKLHPDNYNIAFLLVGLYIFLKTKFKKRIRYVVNVSLIVFAILAVFVSSVYTQGSVKHTEKDKATIELMNESQGILLISRSQESYSRAYYSYGAVYSNSTFISGWMDVDIDPSVIKKIKQLEVPVSTNDSKAFLESLKEFRIEEIITYNSYCDILKQLNFTLIGQKADACLYRVNYSLST